MRGHPEPPGIQRDVSARALWQAELDAGTRTRTTFDPLFRAACLECEADRWDRDGVPSVAAKCRAAADAVIVEAHLAQGKQRRRAGGAP